MSYPEYPLSSFPDKIDTILQATDIVLADLPKMQAYYTAISGGLSVDAAIAQSGIDPSKVFNAGRLNTLIQPIMAIQKFLKDPNEGFRKYVSMRQSEWDTKINQFSWKGEYVVQQYLKNNLVSYADTSGNVLLYIAIQDITSNIPPTNIAYWRPFVVSASGSSLSFRGEYNVATSYVASDMVTANGSLYQCIVANTNKPITNTAFWTLLVGRGISKQYIFTPTVPPNLVPNQIWFKEIPKEIP